LIKMTSPTKTLCIVCIVKNEESYIFEWAAHHRLLGIRNLVFYDNGSTDRTSEILAGWQDEGLCQHIPWMVTEGVSPQMSAYADAIARFKNEYEFAAFFDADEFLAPLASFSIIDWLLSLPAEVGAIAINQRVFGSSGNKVRMPGLVVERFQLASQLDYDENRWVKSTYRISALASINSSHRGILSSGRYILPDGSAAFEEGNTTGKAQSIDRSRLQLNHYIIKSEEEFLLKRQRGGVMAATARERLQRYEDLNFFHGRDARINSLVDNTLSIRAESIRREMRNLPGWSANE
jgi:Glycosyltransferase family 92